MLVYKALHGVVWCGGSTNLREFARLEKVFYTAFPSYFTSLFHKIFGAGF